MTKADKQAKEIAQLKSEVEALKAAQPKPADPGSRPLTKQEQYDYQVWLDKLRHQRESFVPGWLREACAIAATARAPTGRPGVIPEAVRPSGPSGRPAANVPGSGTGWSRETPLGPSPHQRYVDAQLDAADARDKAERIKQEAQLRATDRIDALHAKLVEGKK
jgi:hypothetical protein